MIDSIKKVHFIGIGGIGMSYLANYFLEQGTVVTGSDLRSTIITDQLAQKGAVLFMGQKTENISDDIDLIIVTDAIPDDNPEKEEAKKKGIPVKTNFEVVGEISFNHKTIAVAGNKGKTTTSAMLATVLHLAGCDPTAMVGSIVNEFKCTFKGGKSDLLVVEADEFKDHFLQIHSDIGIVTNIHADHLDYFGTEERMMESFQNFINKIPSDGLCVINIDDEKTKSLNAPQCELQTFGFQEDADVYAKDLRTENQMQYFTVFFQGHEIGEFALPAPGKFNVSNALATIAIAIHLGVSVEAIKKGLQNFKGTWRRFQVLGQYKDTTIVTDYAHNPPSVHGVIEAAQDWYPNRRIVTVFQAHTRHRTKSLFKDFVLSFDPAHAVLISDIYDIPGREQVSKEEMNASILTDAIKHRDEDRGIERIVIESGNLEETKLSLDQIIQPNDVVLFIGASDIYQLAESLV